MLEVLCIESSMTVLPVAGACNAVAVGVILGVGVGVGVVPGVGVGVGVMPGVGVVPGLELCC